MKLRTPYATAVRKERLVMIVQPSLGEFSFFSHEDPDGSHDSQMIVLHEQDYM